MPNKTLVLDFESPEHKKRQSQTGPLGGKTTILIILLSKITSFGSQYYYQKGEIFDLKYYYYNNYSIVGSLNGQNVRTMGQL